MKSHQLGATPPPIAAPSPREAVIGLMKGAVPESADAIDSLWDTYNPDVVLVDDRTRGRRPSRSRSLKLEHAANRIRSLANR